jgi:hypothetical protein
VQSFGGRVADAVGDNLLAHFPSVVDSVRCAITVQEELGKRKADLPSDPVMIWALRILEAPKLSPLYKRVYETASKDSFVSIEKAERKLGYSPDYSNIDAMVRNDDWYIANLAAFEGASGVSHRVPWDQGILRLVKEFS